MVTILLVRDLFAFKNLLYAYIYVCMFMCMYVSKTQQYIFFNFHIFINKILSSDRQTSDGVSIYWWWAFKHAILALYWKSSVGECNWFDFEKLKRIIW